MLGNGFEFTHEYDLPDSDSSSLITCESSFVHGTPCYQLYGNQYDDPGLFVEKHLFYQQERGTYEPSRHHHLYDNGIFPDPYTLTSEDKDFLSDDSYNPINNFFESHPQINNCFLRDDFNLKSWKSAHPEGWNSDDVLNFIYSLAFESHLPLEEVKGEAFQNLSGFQLSKMSAFEFVERDPKYGMIYYEAFHDLLQKGTFVNYSYGDYQLTDYPANVPTVVASIGREDDFNVRDDLHLNDNEIGPKTKNFPASDGLNSYPTQSIAQKDRFHVRTVKRGRPPKSHHLPSTNDIKEATYRKFHETSKAKHLWEFICHLLKNSKGMGKDKIIQWENKELGVFRIVNSKEVAFLWGQHKSSNKMTFEKLSRALRWCKTSGSMADLPGDGKYPKRLCFRFGPRAVNWKTLAF